MNRIGQNPWDGVLRRSRIGCRYRRRYCTAGLLAICTVGIAADSRSNPFAVFVVDYNPAPGQHVNDSNFNDPARALGAPRGGGTGAADNSSLVTLGGFGGSITLGFDHTVQDDPLNPYGMDSIVFGNAFWLGGDPEAHWAECATIEISLDANQNGEADDTWYLIPGSHIPDPTAQYLAVMWDDDVADDAYPPALESWIPPGPVDTWETAAYALPLEVFGAPVVWNPVAGGMAEGIFGYGEYTPTLILGDLNADNVVDDPEIDAESFYTTPDDPLRVGISPRSGGGDAFDIAWAIDPHTGEAAELNGFDFIRLTTAVHVLAGVFGEKSAEIDAVADASPDPFGDTDDDGDIDLLDVARLQVCVGSSVALDMACERADREPDGVITLLDAAALIRRMTGPR